MTRLFAVLLAITVGASAVAAQNTAIIKERKDHYKAMGDAAKPVGAMYKGEADFDLAKVQAALKVFQEKVALLPPLFPDDSKTGGETEALPIIWNEKADFEERFKKLGAAAKAAEAAITDEDTFADNWKTVMGNCSSCHKKFRKPKS